MSNSNDTTHRLAILIHCYYYEIMPNIKKYLDNLSIPREIFINIPNSVKNDAQVEYIRLLFPTAIINFSENRGRDIGGFISLWEKHKNSKFTSVLLVHTKKSPHLHIKQGGEWRTNLLSSILGSRSLADSFARSIHPKSNIGIIGSHKHRNRTMGPNSIHIEKLGKMFSIPKEQLVIDYVSGTILFISPEILDTLCSKLKQSDFDDGTNKPLSYHTDGQLEHAVERFLAILCRSLGKNIKYI
jgi:lipopolysaccharide biosynthesis protein